MRIRRFIRPGALAIAAIGLTAVGGVATGILARAATTSLDATPGDDYAWFDPIIDVERLIAQRYVDVPPLAEMQQRAIAGMIDALHDPYTRYIPAKRIADFDKQIRGEYVGIGATVRMMDGFITIVSPQAGSPALAAGVKPGDRVVAVAGEDVTGRAVDDVVGLLTGKPGTKIDVTFDHSGERFTRTITRKRIVTKSVLGFARVGEQWDFMLDPESKIGYVRINHFGAETGQEFIAALKQLRDQGVKGLVIDLRFNGGGLVASAVEVADSLLDDGLIFSSKGRAHPETTVRATKMDTILPTTPVVLVVNGETASASEIVSGALKGDDRAIVVGERTFGKGVMQATLTLPSGAGRLHLTEQHYYLPTGRPIQRKDDSTVWGVDPTQGYFLSMTSDQYRDMLTVRNELDVIHGAKASPADAAIPAGKRDEAWVRDNLHDSQLALAVRALRERFQTGAWDVPEAGAGKADTEALAAQDELRRLRLLRERMERNLDRVDRRIGALSTTASAVDAKPKLLLPEDANLIGGTVEIRDAAGAPVATLRVTGAGLERWFIDAPLTQTTDTTKDK